MKLLVYGVSKGGQWQRIAAKEVPVLLDTSRNYDKIYHLSSAFSQTEILFCKESNKCSLLSP
jgi:hypothetical protein